MSFLLGIFTPAIENGDFLVAYYCISHSGNVKRLLTSLCLSRGDGTGQWLKKSGNNPDGQRYEYDVHVTLRTSSLFHYMYRKPLYSFWHWTTNARLIDIIASA